MDTYAQFNVVAIDVTAQPPTVQPAEVKRERVDLVARQFRDFLSAGDPADDQPHLFALTPEFKIARQVTPAAAWLSLLIDVGDGRTETLSTVIQMLLIREGTPPASLTARLPQGLTLPPLPPGPTAILIQTAPKIPFMIRDWLLRPAAGFFGEQR